MSVSSYETHGSGEIMNPNAIYNLILSVFFLLSILRKGFTTQVLDAWNQKLNFYVYSSHSTSDSGSENNLAGRLHRAVSDILVLLELKLTFFQHGNK